MKLLVAPLQQLPPKKGELLQLFKKLLQQLQVLLQPPNAPKDDLWTNAARLPDAIAEGHRWAVQAADQFEFAFSPAPQPSAFRQTEFPWRYRRDRRRPNYEAFKLLRHLLARRQQTVRRFNDLTWKLFGSLKVIAYAGTDRHGRRKWRVCCARCGDEKIALAANLLSGRT